MEIELEGKRYVRREGEDTEQRSKQGMGRRSESRALGNRSVGLNGGGGS